MTTERDQTHHNYGFVELLSARVAKGWAWMPTKPHQRVGVDVFIDGELALTLIAEIYRQDLKDQAIGDGFHGFTINFDEMQVGPEKRIEFRIAGTDTTLKIAPQATNWSSFEGVVELLSSAQARGWAWHPNRPNERLVVDLVDGDDVMASTIADQYRKDLFDLAIGDGKYGFIIDVTHGRYSDGRNLRVIISNTNTRLPVLQSISPRADTMIHNILTETQRNFLAPEAVLFETFSPIDSNLITPSTENASSATLLIDLEFYIARNQDVDFQSIDPQQHYLTTGWREGRNPSPWFSVIDYLCQYEDVLSAGLEPMSHYLAHGRDEGRIIVGSPPLEAELAFRERLRKLGKLIDKTYYISQYPNFQTQIVSPALHYLCYGNQNGHGPVPGFDVTYYLDTYPDVRKAGIEPFIHFHEFGRVEGRQSNSQIRDAIRTEFDDLFYLTQSPQLNGMLPIEHFVTYGWREGLNPAPWFDVAYYLRLSPDVEDAEINPFEHFVTRGRLEGRPAAPDNQRKLAPDASRPTILLIGHDAIHSGAEVVLLEVVRWLANHTRYPLKVLLLGLGPLVKQYAQYAETFVITKPVDLVEPDSRLVEFLAGQYAVCYVNTVASGHFTAIYDRFRQFAYVPIVLHVHELEKVISEHIESFSAIAPKTTSFIAVSKSVRHSLNTVFNIDKDRIFLSNAFIRLSAGGLDDVAARRVASRSALGISPSSFVVLGCGTVYPRKGPDLFIEVADALIRREPDLDVTFLWIGSGADLDACRVAVQVPSFQNRVRFIGFRADANELLAAADVFCLTSREDPFPLVCLEAAQYGIPTVFFADAGGISEFVGQDSGVAVPAFKTTTMAGAIRSYAKNLALRERHGLSARARVIESYTADRRILEILVHIREVAKLTPDITVLVLAYNHAKYLKERLDTVFSQSLADTEILILDDCSKDQTLAVAQEYSADPRVRIVTNKLNSGGAFKQWAHGIRLANGTLVWIAEGDDFCSDNLLAELAPAFDDPLVNIAFCKTEIVDETGEVKPRSLARYHGQSDFPFERNSIVMDGVVAVEAGFGALCLIVNGSSALLRRNSVIGGLRAAETFRMCGDWFIYLYALQRGKLFYTSRALNFFRRHGDSIVHLIEGTKEYFSERDKIVNFLVDNFALSRRASKMMLAQLDSEWYRFQEKNQKVQRGEFYKFASKTLPKLKDQRTSRLRIGFYVHGMLFSKGGIERIAAQIANELAWRGHEVFIFCREWGAASPVYPLFESVRVCPVFNENQISTAVPRLRYEIARSDLDVFVAMLSERLFEPILDAAVGLGVKVVASEHNDPWKIEELWWDRSKRLKSFSSVDAIHLLLHGFVTSLPKRLHAKVTVIPNGVLPYLGEHQTVAVHPKAKRFIAIGRLERQKRFDRLIRAFARIANEVIGWDLVIFGSGSEHRKLQAIIDKEGLTDRICLRGIVDDVYGELSQSSVFVIPSEFEGFGIVVIEAQQVGLPCIGYKDCNGPNELIKDGIDGILVDHDDDGTNLAQAMLHLARSPKARTKFGQAGRAAAKEFELTGVVDRWEEFLRSITVAI